MDQARFHFGDRESAWTDLLWYSATVYQASGMVSVQAMRSVDDALFLLATYACSTGRSVEAVARDVVTLRVRFDATGQAKQMPSIDSA
jgi:hypothetical protein